MMNGGRKKKMALLHVDFFSGVLEKCTSMDVILPQNTKNQIGLKGNARNGKYKTAYLLHGMSDDQTIWQRRTSIERYVSEYGIAVVMPDGGLSFYTDMCYGLPYWTFFSVELPKICREFFPQMSDRKEDTLAAGVSMGGLWSLEARAWSLRDVWRGSGFIRRVGRIKKIKGEDSESRSKTVWILGRNFW